MNKRFLKILLIAWVALIWTLSSLPGDSLPKLETLNFDKLAHVTIYFILGQLVFANHKKGNLSRFKRIDLLLIFVIMAALDESHQVLIANRSVSVLDLSANLSGLFLSYFITQRYRTNK